MPSTLRRMHALRVALIATVVGVGGARASRNLQRPHLYQLMLLQDHHCVRLLHGCCLKQKYTFSRHQSASCCCQAKFHILYYDRRQSGLCSPRRPCKWTVKQNTRCLEGARGPCRNQPCCKRKSAPSNRQLPLGITENTTAIRFPNGCPT